MCAHCIKIGIQFCQMNIYLIISQFTGHRIPPHYFTSAKELSSHKKRDIFLKKPEQVRHAQCELHIHKDPKLQCFETQDFCPVLSLLSDTVAEREAQLRYFEQPAQKSSDEDINSPCTIFDRFYNVRESNAVKK